MYVILLITLLLYPVFKVLMFEKMNTSLVSSDCCSWFVKCWCCNGRLSYYKGLVEIETYVGWKLLAKAPMDPV